MSEKNPFQSVILQIASIRKYLDVPEYIWDVLKTSDREIKVNFPVRMDNGKIEMIRGFRVQHDGALGPYKGGIRLYPKADLDKVRALSFWMTVKNAVANLPLGGGKGGIVVDPKKLSDGEIEKVARGYIKAIYPAVGPYVDIPGPDMGTTPQVMSYMMDEFKKQAKKDKGNGLTENEIKAAFTGKVVGKGGSRGRKQATAKGGIYVLQALLAKQNSEFRIQNSEITIAIQGFGNVGYHFARYAKKMGFKVVAVSDSRGGVYVEKGLDVEKTMECKKEKGVLHKCFCVGSVCDAKFGTKITNRQLLELPVDILVPAAVENVITSDNAGKIKAKIVFELANGPTTPEADGILEEKKVMVVPDILANAGGVTVSYFEWQQNLKGEKWSKEKVFAKLKKRMNTSFTRVWKKAKERKVSLRNAAYIVAVEKLASKQQTGTGSKNAVSTGRRVRK